jgi:DNA mismatch repair protein MutS2
MDPHTLELLDFDKIRHILAGYAAGALGKLAALAVEPGTDPAVIREQQALTTEMVEALGSGLNPPFGGLRDVRDAVRRARVEATLTADELAEVASTLRAVAELRGWLDRLGDRFPRLGVLVHGVGEFGAVSNAIAACLDERGRVLDSASRRLAEIRREIQRIEERIQETLRRMLRMPEIRRILRYGNFTMVGPHYVLPIAREHRGELAGSVHRTSASNETVYVEPQAIAEMSAQLSYQRSREQKEVRRILRWLSAQLGQVADAVLASLETLGQLDLIHARGRYSRDYQMTEPDFNDRGQVVLRSARHPLLEYLVRSRMVDGGWLRVDGRWSMAEGGGRSADGGSWTAEPANPDGGSMNPDPESPASIDHQPSTLNHPPSAIPPAPVPRVEPVVPIDIHLGVAANLLVITGPNTGGKTVALKTVGLIAALAQAGLHVPAAEGTTLPVFDDVLADIGDEQSLEQSLSTFSSHVRRITEILGRATERSLVLLDEVGAGTDPNEGAALGRAILDELDAIGCRAMVTTHIGDLKTYALTNPRAENAAVEFDIETLRPLYRVRIGDIGQSNALKIARRLHLPEHLVRRAEDYLTQARSDRPTEWDLVQKLRLEAEQARAGALAARAEAERTREALVRRLADLQDQAEHDARLAEARARLQPGDRVVVPRFGYDRPGRVVKIDPRKQAATVAIGAMQWEVPVAELIPQGVREPEDVSKARAARRRTPRLDDFEVE